VAKKRSGGREKTLAERQAYHQQLGTRTSSTTEGQDFALGSALNSTGRRPSPDEDERLDVPVPAVPRAPRRDGINLTSIGVVVAILVPVVGAALYIENIKSKVQVIETRMSSIEKAQDAAESGFRRELQRIEAAVEKRLTELISVLRESSRKAESTGEPSKKRD
jgi:hypothetical protein